MTNMTLLAEKEFIMVDDYHLHVCTTQSDHGPFVVNCLNIAAQIWASGKTKAEAIAKFKEVAASFIAHHKKNFKPIPWHTYYTC